VNGYTTRQLRTGPQRRVTYRVVDGHLQTTHLTVAFRYSTADQLDAIVQHMLTVIRRRKAPGGN